MSGHYKTLSEAIKSKLHGEGVKAQLIRGGVGSAVIKLAAMGMQFAIVVLLARLLGPSDFGIYAYVMAWVTFLAIPSQFGTPDLVVRETSKAQVTNEWGEMRGVWQWSIGVVLIFSLLFSATAVAISLFFTDSLSVQKISAFYWGMALIPLLTMTRLISAMLQGLRKTVKGMLAENTVYPVLFLGTILVVYFLVPSIQLDASVSIAVNAACATVGLVVAMIVFLRERPAQVTSSVTPRYHTKKWIKAVIPLSFISGMTVINTQIDIVMLGYFYESSSVGMYRIAVQGATLVSFGLTAIAIVVLPYFARFYHSGDMHRFQKLATHGSRLMLLFAVPVATIFIVYGEAVLGVVFGEEYLPAYTALAILSFAHVFHAGFGVVGPLLNVTGNEKVTAKGIAYAALCNIVLNVILIPHYGIYGAALATGITLVLWNVILWLEVQSRLGIDSSALNLKLKVFEK